MPRVLMMERCVSSAERSGGGGEVRQEASEQQDSVCLQRAVRMSEGAPGPEEQGAAVTAAPVGRHARRDGRDAVLTRFCLCPSGLSGDEQPRGGRGHGQLLQAEPGVSVRETDQLLPVQDAARHRGKSRCLFPRRRQRQRHGYRASPVSAPRRTSGRRTDPWTDPWTDLWTD